MLAQRLIEILENLQENTWRCNPKDVDIAVTAILTAIRRELPKEKETYPNDMGVNPNYKDGYNQALTDVLAKLK
jgi:hypothetical protein